MPRIASPEERITSIVALASSVDGIDIVVAAHEGFTYSVQALNPEYEIYADELAAASTVYLESSWQKLAGNARAILADQGGKALLVADVGEGFTVAILGERQAVESLLDPVRRLARGAPISCPNCSAVLDVHTYTCPSCGKRIPFTATLCPYCGTVSPARSCPNCGAELMLVLGRVEPAKAEKQRSAVAVTPRAQSNEGELVSEEKGETSLLIRLTIGGGVVVAYYASSLLLGIDPVVATIVGAAPLAASLGLILTEKRRR